MGSNLTEASSYSTNVVGPDAGNKVTAASVRVMGTSLANRTKYIFDRIASTAGTHFKLPSATSITRVCESDWLVNDPALTAGAAAVPPNGSFFAGTMTAGHGGQQALMVPHGATITAAALRIIPASHGSIAGITLPILSLRKIHMTTGTETTFATQGDASVSAAAYSIAHDITITGATEVVDRSIYYYYALLNWEVGGGAAADGVVLSTRLTYTAPNIDDGY